MERWGSKTSQIIGKEMDEAYIEMVKGLSVYPEVIKKQHDLKIVYTPIHGTGIMLVPRGVETFWIYQCAHRGRAGKPDGNFPTVVYPNPEESEAMSIGLKKAKEAGCRYFTGHRSRCRSGRHRRKG